MNPPPPHCAVSTSGSTSVALPKTTAPALPELPTIALGRYRHYKGGDYEVLGVVRHSESLEPLVLYRPLHHDSGLWVRPHAMFLETVEFGGARVLRFAPVLATGSATGMAT